MKKDTFAIFKLLSHPVRLRLCELLRQGTMTGEELAAALGMKKLQLLTHLNQMRNLGIMWSSHEKRPQYHDIDKMRLDVALDDFAKCAKLNLRRQPGKLKKESKVGWFTNTTYMPKNMWKQPAPPLPEDEMDLGWEVIVIERKPRRKKKKKKKSRAARKKRSK